MKTLKALAFTAITIFFVFSTSCKETNDDPPYSQTTNQGTSGDKEVDEDKAEKPRYYVKYEVETKTNWTNTTNEIIFYSDKGLQSVVTTGTSTWTGTYGPLSYGHSVYLKIKRNNLKDYNYGGTNHARIYICREKEPFVVKAEATGKKDVDLTYRIDF